MKSPNFGSPSSDGLSKIGRHFSNKVHRGAFCQFPFRLIYYYGSNKSTGKETVKSHLCALFWNLEIFGKRMKINQALHMDEMNMPKN